jgi:hypothetical protein
MLMELCFQSFRDKVGHASMSVGSWLVGEGNLVDILV